MSKKPNQMNIFSSGIKNFFGGDVVLSSPDLIAVKCGIKKMTRIELAARQIFGGLEKELARHGIAAVLSNEKLFGKYNLYASKDKETAEKAKNSDPSFKIVNRKKTFSEVLGDIRLFSRLLSYPSCCVEDYINNVLSCRRLAESSAFRKIPSQIPFLFNNLLNGVSNYYLSFHFPCSFTCRKTLEYQKRIFQKMKQLSPLFAATLETYLKRPYLIFLKPALGNMYVSWDNRMGFIFEGKVNGKELFYSRILTFKTNYPDYADNQKDAGDFQLIATQINRGNRVVFKDDSFWIFNN